MKSYGVTLGLMLAGCVSAKPMQDSSILAGAKAQLRWAPNAKLEMFSRRIDGPASRLPLVLLHPWGLDHQVWQEVLPELSRDRTVVLVDLPAHGRSDKTWTRWSMARLGRAVLDVMDAEGFPEVAMVGNSLGGAVSIEVARQAPARVRLLGLIGCPGGGLLPSSIRRAAHQMANEENLATLSDEAWIIGMWAGSRSWNPRTQATLEGILHSRRNGPEWRAFARSAAAVLGAVAEYAPDLSAIHIPALVVHGAQDPLITEPMSRALAEKLPRARMVVFEECGHLPELECPESLARELRRFLLETESVSVNGFAEAAL